MATSSITHSASGALRTNSFGFITVSSSGKAADIIALDNTNALAYTPTTTLGSITTTSWNAKVFRVGSKNVVMKQLVLPLYNTLSLTQTINFYLYNVDGSNAPTGTALASYSEAKTFTASGAYYTFTTTMGGFVMQSGTKYALVVNSASTTTVMSWTTVNPQLVYIPNPADWSFEANLRSTNSGSSWASNTFYNGLQMTVMTEPSTDALTPLDDYFFTEEELVQNVVQKNLFGVGFNGYGQLGDNTSINKSSPVQTVSNTTDWATLASGGYSTAAAIKYDGTLWLWGNNAYGQLGDNTSISKSSPVQTITNSKDWKQIACSNFGAFAQGHIAAIKKDNTLWVWGSNSYGELGIGSLTNMSSPIQTALGGSNWKQVSCGSRLSAAVKTDGSLWAWGNNYNGALGINSPDTYKTSPVQEISGSYEWSKIACGRFHMAALKTDGSIWSWGSNINGQLGDNTTINRSSPVQSLGGNDWIDMSCGVENTIALKNDGSLWAWGQNNYGQLGDNTLTSKSSPIQSIGGNSWSKIATNGYHVSAIKIDGTLWRWGQNSFGQLGDNTNVNKSSPIQVSSDNKWKEVSCGYYHSYTTKYLY